MITEHLGKELLFLDGGMGTLLQEKGLLPGELPETWNITHKEEIIEIHRKYYDAGSNIVLTNTFGANAMKFQDAAFPLEQIIYSAVSNAKEAALSLENQAQDCYVALDIGPTGKLLKPMGDLEFEDAYDTFKEVAILGEQAGADLIHIETMSDTYEVKAAVLAAKENTNLPIFVTLIFDERGKLLTGADVPSVVALLEGLRVNAIGINCGLGPKQMLPILEQLLTYSSLPIIVKPNAGLPKQKNGETYFDVSPESFAETMTEIVEMGAVVVGGCCGTTPAHIKKMVDAVSNLPIKKITPKNQTIVSSYGKSVEIGSGSKIIGERINPTGKKKLKEALKKKQIDYIVKEAIAQEEAGAHILDVNVGLPDIDEVSVMKRVVQEIQGVTNLPLQIDTVDVDAMESAMRIYNGKPLINSVSGKKESMNQVFPLIKKYGGVVVGLTLDENGIPATAQGRLGIAKKILASAALYGIDKKDIIIDVLCMTISSEPSGALTTLESLKLIKEALDVHTVLGVSNISFGLPNRPIINSNFYTMAMQQGLSAGIINPLSSEMMKSYYAYHALMNLDENCENFISQYANKNTIDEQLLNLNEKEISLQFMIEKGLKEDATEVTKILLKNNKPLDIINQHLIPALDVVGKGFENGTVFLPQLLMSAEAAKNSFAVIKDILSESNLPQEQMEKVVLATVKGDIHDIGKNIVKVLLENYNFDVIDLGKDVAPEEIVQIVVDQNVRLVGLSALMTTTVVSMEKTIQLLKKTRPNCMVMVGGAVLNQDYADMIGADFYGKDAMQSVYYAQDLLQKNSFD